MEGTKTYRRWLQRAALYTISMAGAGAATGLALAAAGAGVSALWPDVTLPLATGLGAVAFAYALHELGFLRLPVPGRSWQVPVEWLQGGFYRSAVIFGGAVGFGFFTRVSFAALPILLAWLFVSGNVLYGLLAGLVWGATRALSLYSVARAQGPEDAVQVGQWWMGLAPVLHLSLGLALATFAAYFLAAPYLP